MKAFGKKKAGLVIIGMILVLGMVLLGCNTGTGGDGGGGENQPITLTPSEPGNPSTPDWQLDEEGERKLVVGMTVISNPINASYQGQAPNLTGLRVRLHFSDNTFYDSVSTADLEQFYTFPPRLAIDSGTGVARASTADGTRLEDTDIWNPEGIAWTYEKWHEVEIDLFHVNSHNAGVMTKITIPRIIPLERIQITGKLGDIYEDGIVDDLSAISIWGAYGSYDETWDSAKKKWVKNSGSAPKYVPNRELIPFNHTYWGIYDAKDPDNLNASGISIKPVKGVSNRWQIWFDPLNDGWEFGVSESFKDATYNSEANNKTEDFTTNREYDYAFYKEGWTDDDGVYHPAENLPPKGYITDYLRAYDGEPQTYNHKHFVDIGTYWRVDPYRAIDLVTPPTNWPEFLEGRNVSTDTDARMRSYITGFGGTEFRVYYTNGTTRKSEVRKWEDFIIAWERDRAKPTRVGTLESDLQEAFYRDRQTYSGLIEDDYARRTRVINVPITNGVSISKYSTTVAPENQHFAKFRYYDAPLTFAVPAFKLNSVSFKSIFNDDPPINIRISALFNTNGVAKSAEEQRVVVASEIAKLYRVEIVYRNAEIDKNITKTDVGLISSGALNNSGGTSPANNLRGYRMDEYERITDQTTTGRVSVSVSFNPNPSEYRLNRNADAAWDSNTKTARTRIVLVN